MTLVACGLNHVTAPVALRESIAFPPDEIKAYLKNIMQSGAANEAMILSTCNRVEIYTEIDDPTELERWFGRNWKVSLDAHWYTFHEQQAVSHILRVASGLNSMILGEPQILGQMKHAYAVAQETGSIGTRLQRLFQFVFNVSKKVRTQTSIGVNPLTLGYCSVTLAKQLFSDLSKRSVLLIGAGEVTQSIALHFYNQGVRRFIVASRSSSRAKNLASMVHGHWISLSDMPIYLKESDIVIAATTSEVPVLGKGVVETALKARKHRPIFMVDLAVPRDIEPEVASLEDVYLYNIDDLKSIISDNQQHREAAAKQAENIIDLQARHFILDLQSLEANVLIRQLRTNLQQLSAQELTYALAQLEQGGDPKQTLSQFAHNLINKIAHTPCAQMKKAAFDGRMELLAFARQLLDIH